MLEINKIYNEDCLIGMQKIADKSIDCIICDLPYGTTACSWDVIIPFDKLWEQYNRIIKDGGAIVLFGSEPFSSYLRMSNIKNYKYDWIWDKSLAGNGILAKKQPLKIHEIISVFNSNIYYPQKTKGKYRSKMGLKASQITGGDEFADKIFNDEYYPLSILDFSIASRLDRLHPTQKSLPLIEYLVKTYSNKNDLILDNCMGSGTTAIACLNTNRNFIGFELDKEYFDIANKRIQQRLNTPTFFDNLITDEPPRTQTTLFD